MQEVAFTLADGIAYVEAARARGLAVDAFAPRLSFFFNAHNDLFEEVAKFRAARRHVGAHRCASASARRTRSSLMLRFHTQTAGSTLQARQVDVNVVRVTLQALAAVLGGTQSLHTNGRDEALALPSEASAVLALRTQQVLAHESGVADVVDPLGGSPYVEALTDEIERRAREILDEGRRAGRRVAAIEQGFAQRGSSGAPTRRSARSSRARTCVVGVNRFEQQDEAPARARSRIDPAIEREAVERVRGRPRLARRDDGRVRPRRAGDAPRGTANLLPPCSPPSRPAHLGEICRRSSPAAGRSAPNPFERCQAQEQPIRRWRIGCSCAWRRRNGFGAASPQGVFGFPRTRPWRRFRRLQ